MHDSSPRAGPDPPYVRLPGRQAGTASVGLLRRFRATVRRCDVERVTAMGGNAMTWASALSVSSDLDRAVDEIVEGVRADLDGRPPDLAVAFVSAEHSPASERLPGLLRKGLGGGLVLGCSAGGVIGGGREVEDSVALSVTAATLPGVEIAPFHLTAGDLPAAGAAPAEWRRVMRVESASAPQFILLPDPLSFPAEALLEGLDAALPESPKVGGLASGATGDDENLLFVGAGTYRSGAVGVSLDGNVRIDTVVAQGCRPIGDPVFVTAGEGNVIRSLDGHAPLEVMREIYDGLTAADQDLFRRSLFLGVVMTPGRSEYSQGDFLVRNLIGLEESTGSLVVGADIREGMVVQMHLRDARTSSNDLDALLSRYVDAQDDGLPPEGALLFSCMGRGAGLYGVAGHDSEAFARHIGPVPVGGFFCNGEIGAVQGRTFLHGYTSSFGVFRPRS